MIALSKQSTITLSDMNTMPQRRAILIQRVIWAALLAGPLAFLAVIVFVILPQATTETASPPQPILNLVCFLMLLTTVPVGFVVRYAVFKRAGGDGLLRPSTYYAGNIIFWACCEGVAIFGLVVAMVNHTLWPTIVVTAICLSLQVLTFPKVSKLKTPDVAIR